jgi:hypothetical protein
MNTIRVKPAKGMRIRRIEKPGEFLPETAIDVPARQYYLRRIREGSLERVTLQTAKKKETSK